MKTLQTKRLLLRAWQLSDAADSYEYAKSSQVKIGCRLETSC